MAKKKTENQIVPVQLPDIFRVIGGDISLKRPGFSSLVYKKNEDGTLNLMDVKTMCIDNKKDKKKEKGELLDDVLRGITTFFPDEEKDDIQTFYVREKYISNHGSIYESSIYEAVGISDWYLWRLHKTWYELYPNTIKKLIAGNGNADKQVVADALKHYVGERVYGTDDESDAVAVAVAWLIQQGAIKQFESEATGGDNGS